jgi:hypothetical protein
MRRSIVNNEHDRRGLLEVGGLDVMFAPMMVLSAKS